jgi:hypothetical protein
MSNILTIVMNGESQVEYDRNKPLAGPQRDFLDKMDTSMDAGIALGDVEIKSPSALQRAQFVALQLVSAIRASDEQRTAAMLAYLANRIPELKQVRATSKDQDVGFDFVFDKDYVPEKKVHFMKPGSDGTSLH